MAKKQETKKSDSVKNVSKKTVKPKKSKNQTVDEIVSVSALGLGEAHVKGAQVSYVPLNAAEKLDVPRHVSSQVFSDLLLTRYLSDAKKTEFEAVDRYKAMVSHIYYPLGSDLRNVRRMIQSMIVTDEDKAKMRVRKLGEILDGKTHIGDDRLRIEEVKLPGRRHLEDMLSEYMYQVCRMRTNLPVDLPNHLGRMSSERLLTYAQMVADRYLAISNLSYDSISSDGMDAMLADLTADGQMEDIREQLEDLTQRARTRYVQQQVLQPLFRDVLIKRVNIGHFAGMDVIDAALHYNDWRRKHSHHFVKEGIIAAIHDVVTANPWVSEMIALREACQDGVEVDSTYALYVLKFSLPVADRDRFFSYDIDEEDKADGDDSPLNDLKITSPFMTYVRRAAIRNVHGDPLVITDDMKSYASIAIPESTDILKGLISLQATLKRLKIVDKIDIDFITRHPEWSGLIDLTGDGFSDARTAAARVVEPLARHRLFCAMMRGEYAFSDLTGLFDEPNREDLQKILLSNLSVFHQAYQVVSDVIADLLHIFSESVEWGHSPIWAELEKVGLLTRDSSPTRLATPRYSRTTLYGSALPIVNGSRVDVTRYIVEDGYERYVKLPRTVSAIAQRDGNLGSMTTSAFTTYPFSVSWPTMVDLYEVMGADIPGVMKKEILSNVSVLRLKELGVTHEIFLRPFTLHITGGEEDLSNAFAQVTEVTPSLILRNHVIERQKSLPTKLLVTPVLALLAGYDADSADRLDPQLAYEFSREGGLPQDLVEMAMQQDLAMVDPAKYLKIEHETVELPPARAGLFTPVTVETYIKWLYAASYRTSDTPEQVTDSTEDQSAQTETD